MLAGHTRLQRNPLTDQAGINFCADIDDRARGLVTDDHRLLHDVVANAAMVVVVHIGTADPNRANLHHHMSGCGYGKGRSSMVRVVAA